MVIFEADCEGVTVCVCASSVWDDYHSVSWTGHHNGHHYLVWNSEQLNLSQWESGHKSLLWYVVEYVIHQTQTTYSMWIACWFSHLLRCNQRPPVMGLDSPVVEINVWCLSTECFVCKNEWQTDFYIDYNNSYVLLTLSDIFQTVGMDWFFK